MWKPLQPNLNTSDPQIRSRKLLECNCSSQTEKPREEIDDARKEKLQKKPDR